MKVEFEPTQSYMREVLRFRAKHASDRDKVASYNEARFFWEKDKFLRANHGPEKPKSTSREGRKLHIAEFDKKMKTKL
jgi:hypothetical protein